MDFTPIYNAIITLIAAALPVLFGKLWSWIEEHIKASAMDRLSAAVERGAGQVADIVSSSPAVGDALNALKEQAIAAVAEQIAETMRHTLTRGGGTPDNVATMLRGEFGKLTVRFMK